MDEDGRNGRKWHLAQQITYHVIMHILSHKKTTRTPLSHRYEGGDFYFFYKYQKNFPLHLIIIIYNLLTNSKSKYGII